MGSENVHPKAIHYMASNLGPDRLVVRTLSCGRIKPVSNLGLDRHPSASRAFEKVNKETDQNKKRQIKSTKTKKHKKRDSVLETTSG